MRHFVLVCATMLVLSACGFGDTHVVIENHGQSSVTVVLRDRVGGNTLQIEAVAPSKSSTTKDIDWPSASLKGVEVQASDGFNGGTLDLSADKTNLIQVFDDHRAPYLYTKANDDIGFSPR